MSNDLQLFKVPSTALSLPEFLVRLQIGTVEWPGQPTRKYLAGGMNLTSNQRAEAERSKTALEEALSPAGTNGLKAVLVIVGRMLMAYPSAAMTDDIVEARAESYLDALIDLPPWAVAQAIKRWNRGECGARNYNFAPAPAILREVTEQVVEPYRRALGKIDTVLNALTLDRAMDSTPLPAKNQLVPKLRSV